MFPGLNLPESAQILRSTFITVGAESGDDLDDDLDYLSICLSVGRMKTVQNT